MKIDWKLRLTNKTFWVALVSAVVLLTQQLGLNIFPENWADILNTILTIFIILGVIVDTSTPGMNDIKNNGQVNKNTAINKIEPTGDCTEFRK